MKDDKYTMFRNFMSNELQITRDDIERWTKETITTQVEKRLREINIEDIVKEVAKIKVYVSREEVAERMAKRLVENIKIVEVLKDDKGHEYCSDCVQDTRI